MRRSILGCWFCLWVVAYPVTSDTTPECQLVINGQQHLRFSSRYLTLKRASGDGCFFQLRLVEGDVRQTPRFAAVRLTEDSDTNQLFIANDTEALAENCGTHFLRQVPFVISSDQKTGTLEDRLRQSAKCFDESNREGVGRYSVYAIRIGLSLDGKSNASVPYIQYVNESGTKLYSQGGVLSLGYRANLGYSMLHFYPLTSQVDVPLSALSKEKLLIDWKFIWALATSATTLVFASMATYALLRN